MKVHEDDLMEEIKNLKDDLTRKDTELYNIQFAEVNFKNEKETNQTKLKSGNFLQNGINVDLLFRAIDCSVSRGFPILMRSKPLGL